MKRIMLFKSTLVAALVAPSLMIAGCSFELGTQPDAYVVDDAPPPVVYEQPSPQPDVDAVWIEPEYVQIGGRYELRHGRWDHRPRGHTRWVASHYEHRSSGYVYIDGRWD